MKFHDKLIELRKAKGWSQEELGDKLDVTRQTVSKWELGQTTPEMDKLIELSRLFGVTIDELVGNQAKAAAPVQTVICAKSFRYEYKSKRRLFGLPLVHINIGFGIHKAKGIISIGTIAKGILAVGAVSIGGIALGGVSLGGIALGALALALAAFGGIAVGVVAVGGIAVGVLAIGGLAVGMYSIGGCAVASRIALGGYAQGHIAIGDKAAGDFAFRNLSQLTQADYLQIRQVILREYPGIWRWLLGLFVNSYI